MEVTNDWGKGRSLESEGAGASGSITVCSFKRTSDQTWASALSGS
jgi:hypothetical protein